MNYIKDQSVNSGQLQPDAGSGGDARWVTQTKFYDPNQPPDVCTGNCTEAALASLFGLKLEDVPSMQGLVASEYWDALKAFVRSRGYVLNMQDPSHRPAGLYLADGPSDRGCGHFVVMRDGEMVHDPHPSRAGLRKVERVWSLMVLDPSTLAARQPAGVEPVAEHHVMPLAREVLAAQCRSRLEFASERDIKTGRNDSNWPELEIIAHALRHPHYIERPEAGSPWKRADAPPAPAAVPVDGWIDISERKPEKPQEVLFVLDGRTVAGAWIGDIFWYSNKKRAALWWQPFPEPRIGAATHPQPAAAKEQDDA